jgi:hypothetical protein
MHVIEQFKGKKQVYRVTNPFEEQVDDYINAFFAGAKDIDFYSLIRTYTTLEPDDVKLIQSYF